MYAGVINPNFDISQALIGAAYRIACKAHRGQVRKYTGEPYVNHCIDVAERLVSVGFASQPGSGTGIVVAAGLLHDVLEDCPYTEYTLAEALDKEAQSASQHIYDHTIQRVVRIVKALTDAPKNLGNRAARKEMDRKRLAKTDGLTQSVKYADLLSNTSSIVEHDPKFARVYLEEKRQLLAVMTQGNGTLRRQVADQLAAAQNKLAEMDLNKARADFEAQEKLLEQVANDRAMSDLEYNPLFGVC